VERNPCKRVAIAVGLRGTVTVFISMSCLFAAVDGNAGGRSFVIASNLHSSPLDAATLILDLAWRLT
jgi:hypothetical protein